MSSQVSWALALARLFFSRTIVRTMAGDATGVPVGQHIEDLVPFDGAHRQRSSLTSGRRRDIQ